MKTQEAESILSSSFFQNLSSTDRMWIVSGSFLLLSLLAVWYLEQVKSPKISNIPLNDLRLSPGQVSFLLLGSLKPEFILAATFLDWKRRGFIESTSFTTHGFNLIPDAGPLLENEEYLMHLLFYLCPSGLVDFSIIKNYRKNQSDLFYEQIQTWFNKIEDSLKEAELIYKHNRNHGNALVYGLLALAFYFMGFIGLYQNNKFALLTILAASLYFALAIQVYGAHPPKGQAVYRTLSPLKRLPLQDLEKKFPFLDKTHIYLYTLSLGRYLRNPLSTISIEQEFVTSVKESFVGQVAF